MGNTISAVPEANSVITLFIHRQYDERTQILFMERLMTRRKIKPLLYIGIALLTLPVHAYSQSTKAPDSIQYYTLDQCIAYALQYQPRSLQSMVNITIAQKTNAINLSGWLPQVNLSANVYHYIQLPTSLVIDQASPESPLVPEKAGVYNTSTPQLAVSEALFSPGLLYSAETAHLLVEQAKQASDSNKINIVASVSKSFYALLLNLEQIDISKEDTTRLGRTMRDAFHQYQGGIVDQTDYKEAIIALNNSKAQLKQAQENVRPLYASLQEEMGFPPEKRFNINFDTAQMTKQIATDTNQVLKYESRIEYQLLSTAQLLQEKNINYYRYGFLPTVSVFYSYDYEFENNNFSQLFSQAYPYSYVGASLNIPLFTGFGRFESIQRAKLQGQLLNLDQEELKLSIYSQYTTTLANYKSNLYSLAELKTNDAMAKDVYNVVTLQYKQGIVPYLNVITAETDLISSESNYINTLFQLLSSKVDLDKALGNISPKH